MMDKNFYEQIVSRCEKDGDCLIWTGCCIKPSKSDTGRQYGIIRYQGSNKYVHRLLYERHTGEEIPSDHQIVRLCNSHLCVNPEHHDCVPRKGLLKHRWRETCDKGHPYELSESGVRYCKTCRIEKAVAKAVERQEEKRKEILKSRPSATLRCFGKFQAEGYSSNITSSRGAFMEAASRMSLGDVLIYETEAAEDTRDVLTKFHQTKRRVKVFKGRLFTIKTEGKNLYLYRAKDEADLEKARKNWPTVLLNFPEASQVVDNVEDSVSSVASNPMSKAASDKRRA